MICRCHQQFGGPTIRVDPDQPELLADMGAAATASQARAARQEGVDEHRRPCVQSARGASQSSDDLVADDSAGPGTRVLARAYVEVGPAQADVGRFDERPARHRGGRRDLGRLDQVAALPHQCLHVTSCRWSSAALSLVLGRAG